MIFSRWLVSEPRKASTPRRDSTPSIRGSDSFRPLHLRWDKGYARPRGGRHLARNIRLEPKLQNLVEYLSSKEGRRYLRSLEKR